MLGWVVIGALALSLAKLNYIDKGKVLDVVLFESKGLFTEWIKAKYKKVCPTIEFYQGDK